MRKITITNLTNIELLRRSCDMTRKEGLTPSTMSLEKILLCEHSPIHFVEFWIELKSIPSFVSTHIVRHKVGVSHFVESNRDDRGGADPTLVNRLTPVNHGIKVNAQALINMSRKRLCYNSHHTTVSVWRELRKEMKNVQIEMANAMVPECVYRGVCPELRQCKAGIKNVMAIYADVPIQKLRKQQLP